MIELRAVNKHYGKQRVLLGVNMTVAQGEVCVLLGPSGAGKSTLLRIINGLETFDSGTVSVDGISLPAAAGAAREATLRQIRRKVGMVFQQFNLFPNRTVLENVIDAPMYVLKQSRSQAVATARELLNRVGMLPKCDAYPASLSGGEQQRVAIARTLAMKPKAILFDEPTSSLDPNATTEIVAVMQELAKDGQGMIVVTHSMHFARNVAETVHFLHSGTIVESGSPEQIFESPEHELTRSFLADSR